MLAALLLASAALPPPGGGGGEPPMLNAHLTAELAGYPATNVLLVKVNWWLNL